MKLKNRPFHAAHDGLALSAAPDEDDELIQAIDNDHKGADDVWELHNDPDVQGIDSFWNGVQKDLESDPGWYSFSDD